MKKLNTKNSGDYAIITFAVRGEMLIWIENQKNKSELIRNLLKREMEKEKK